MSTIDAGRLTAAGVPDLINRDGLSLQAILESARRLDELSCARVVANIAEAVHAAQRSGQPLGALTPAAIRVRPDGGVGFAAAPASPRYIAPERLRGGAGDRRSDVFALGVMLWEALAHARLFDGSDDAAIGRAVAEVPIRSPSELNANVPAELDAICKRALAREPADRYQSANVMAADIDAVLGDAGYPESSEPIAAFIAALTPPPRPMAVVAAVPLPAVEPAAATQPAAATPPAMSPALQRTQPLPSIAPAAIRPPTSPPVTHEAPSPSPAVQPRAATQPPIAQRPASQPPIVQRPPSQPPIIQPPAERSAAATQLGMARTAPLPTTASASQAHPAGAAPASAGPRDTLPPPFVPRQGAATAILGSPGPAAAAAAPMRPAATTILGSPGPIAAAPPAPVELAVQAVAPAPMRPAATTIVGSPGPIAATPPAPVELAVQPVAPAPMKPAATAILGSLSGAPLAAVPVPPHASEPPAPPHAPASPFAASMPASLSSFAPEADEALSFGPPAMPEPSAPAARPADAAPRLGMPPGMTAAPASPAAPLRTTDSGVDDGDADDEDDDGGDFGAERHVDPAAVVALHRTDRTTGGRDVLAGWGWTTGSIQAITDEDELQDTARASHRRLVIAIGSALGAVAVIVIAALVFSGSKQPDADPHAAASIPAAPLADRAPAPAPAAAPSLSASPAIAPAPGDPASTPPAGALAAAAPTTGSAAEPAGTPPAGAPAAAAPTTGSAAEPAGMSPAAAAPTATGTPPASTSPTSPASPAGPAATPPAGRVTEPALAAVPPPAPAPPVAEPPVAEPPVAEPPKPAAEPPPAPARPPRIAAEPARKPEAKKPEAKKPEAKKPAPARRPTPDRIAHATGQAQPIDPYAAPAPPKFDPAAAYKTGIQQYARGDINAALATFRTSLSSSPDYAPTWRGLGVVYDKLGNKGQARSAFQRYLKLAPDAPDAEQIRERLQHLGSG